MPSRRLAGFALAVIALILGACGGGASLAVSSARSSSGAIPVARPAATASPLQDWPTFGLNAQRTASTDAATGITRANVAHLRHLVVHVPGTVDSAPVYLHGVSAGGRQRNLVVATSSYGRTFAIDADSGALVWTFTPPGYSGWAGSDQVTSSSPTTDPSRSFVYSASSDKRVHKLSLADGHEQPGWPVTITRLPWREKMDSALNVDGPYLVAMTGGYFGDARPYQGHLVLIDRSSGRVASVFNTLCAGRRSIIDPGTCSASDSAIWAREGAVVEPGGARLLVSTGNGPYDGRSNFGDSVLELTVPGLRLRQAYTPSNQASLSSSDTDLGSSAPALLGHGLAAIAGKDGVLRVLRLSRLDGSAPSGLHRTGGEVQTLATPGGSALFSSPAVWTHAGHTTLFVADYSGTEAYALRGGRLRPVWKNNIGGNSPVVAGGLMYVYDPSGGVKVYVPSSPRPITELRCGSGHWNSAIVTDGHVVVGEGNYFDHRDSGVVDIWAA